MLSRFFKKEKSNFKTQAPKSRKLRMESLEDRALLRVMPFEYDALRDANPEIGLPADRSDVNIVELTELTRAALQKAVDLAATTPQDDLIYVRTTEDASTIDLIEGVAISIDAENFGSLTIAASKETPVNFSVAGLDGAALTINAGVVVLANANFVDVDAAERGESAAAVVVAEGKGRYVPANVSAFAAQDADAERFSASRLDAKTQTNDAERLQNNYAVLFYGGGDPQANDERYLANLQDLYEVLTVGWGLPKENIYILYAGGVNASTYVSATPDQSVTYRFTDPAKGEVETRELVRSDLSFAKGSPVCAATAANLTPFARRLPPRRAPIRGFSFFHTTTAPVCRGSPPIVTTTFAVGMKISPARRSRLRFFESTPVMLQPFTLNALAAVFSTIFKIRRPETSLTLLPTGLGTESPPPIITKRQRFSPSLTPRPGERSIGKVLRKRLRKRSTRAASERRPEPKRSLTLKRIRPTFQKTRIRTTAANLSTGRNTLGWSAKRSKSSLPRRAATRTSATRSRRRRRVNLSTAR